MQLSTTRALRISVLFAVASIGCNAVLGIEEIPPAKQRPSDDATDASISPEGGTLGVERGGPSNTDASHQDGDGQWDLTTERSLRDGAPVSSDAAQVWAADATSDDRVTTGEPARPDRDASAGRGGSADASGANDAGRGDGGAAGDGATTGAGTGGNGGTGGTGGTGGNGGGTADGGNESGSEDAGADSPSAGRITITGTIIDSWRFPIAGAFVAIGDSPVVVTDSRGMFEITGVQPPYDVMFYVPEVAEWWVFQGLTAASPRPTLQVDAPVVGDRGDKWSQAILVSVNEGALSGSTLGRMCFASPAGVYAAHELSADQWQSWLAWYGPRRSDPGTFHLLRTVASGDSPRYTGYQTIVNSVLDEALSGTVSFDLAGASELPTTTLTVTSNDAIDIVRVDVQFDRLAVINVIDDWAFKSPKTYTVPVKGNWTYAVSAVQGNYIDWPVRIATKQGLSGSSIQVALELPIEPRLITPGPTSAPVDTLTEFLWTSPPGVNIAHIEFDARDGLANAHLRIVTTERSVRIPNFPRGMPTVLPKGALSYWYVQSYGAQATTDAMVGPTGYVGAYDDSMGRIGPEDRDGTRTYAEPLDFSTAR